MTSIFHASSVAPRRKGIAVDPKDETRRSGWTVSGGWARARMSPVRDGEAQFSNPTTRTRGQGPMQVIAGPISKATVIRTRMQAWEKPHGNIQAVRYN